MLITLIWIKILSLIAHLGFYTLNVPCYGISEYVKYAQNWLFDILICISERMLFICFVDGNCVVWDRSGFLRTLMRYQKIDYMGIRGLMWASSLGRYVPWSLSLNLPENVLSPLKTKGMGPQELCVFLGGLKFFDATIFIAWWVNIWTLLIKVLYEITLNIFFISN